jgi:hypothetical protein
MPTILGNKIFTISLTEETLTIVEADGVVAISVQNTSSVDATIIGNAVVAGSDSGNITLTENSSVTISSTNGKPINYLEIDASATGCTVQIVANS